MEITETLKRLRCGCGASHRERASAKALEKIKDDHRIYTGDIRLA